MTDVGIMVEEENARIWEELNAEPEIDRYRVYYDLGYADEFLSDAYSRLADAADDAEGHPLEDRIKSILEEVDSLQREIRGMRDRLMKEVKSA